MFHGQGMKHRIFNTEIDDNDDNAKANVPLCEGIFRNLRRRKNFREKSPSPLDNRYTDVVSLHRNRYTNITNHKPLKPEKTMARNTIHPVSTDTSPTHKAITPRQDAGIYRGHLLQSKKINIFARLKHKAESPYDRQSHDR